MQPRVGWRVRQQQQTLAGTHTLQVLNSSIFEAGPTQGIFAQERN